MASEKKIVLVTGVTGYIAAHAALQLLEKGYTVRGTSRSQKSVQPLIDGIFKPYADRFEVAETSDITKGEAYNEAIKGVHGVLHVASPVNFDAKTPNELIEPAVKGTQALLNAALDHAGPQLKAVVVTSSVAAINQLNPDYSLPKARFTEDSWNEAVEKLYAEKGQDMPLPHAYAASKIVSARAVYKFRNEKKPPFSLLTVNPGVVFGPIAQPPDTPDKLNATSKLVFDYFSGKTHGLLRRIGTGSFVDVRDVAKLHIWALEHPDKADGERFIAVASTGYPQAVADIFRKEFPDRADKMFAGDPGKGYNKDYSFDPEIGCVDNSRTNKITQMHWIGIEKSLKDMGQQFEQYL